MNPPLVKTWRKNDGAIYELQVFLRLIISYLIISKIGSFDNISWKYIKNESP